VVVLDVGVHLGGPTSTAGPAAAYYQGADYHGVIQLLTEPSGHRLAGRWIGSAANWRSTHGPWTLVLVDS